MLAMWQEFEQAQSIDARFAKSIDRILPLVINMANNGGSWVVNGVCKSQVIKRNHYLQDLSPKLWAYVLKQIDVACEKGWLINDWMHLRWVIILLIITGNDIEDPEKAHT